MVARVTGPVEAINWSKIISLIWSWEDPAESMLRLVPWLLYILLMQLGPDFSFKFYFFSWIGSLVAGWELAVYFFFLCRDGDGLVGEQPENGDKSLHFLYLISERERIFQYIPPSDNTPLQAKKAKKAEKTKFAFQSQVKKSFMPGYTGILSPRTYLSSSLHLQLSDSLFKPTYHN